MASTAMPICFFFFLCIVAISYGASDSEILLKFKSSMQNSDQALASWKTSTTPCSGNNANWVGVLCEKGNIWGLKLENMGLKGTIDVSSLKDLPGLRTVSLMKNQLGGPFPDFGQLGALKSLFLSDNQLSGKITNEIFNKMQSLKKLHLAHNQFTGNIPETLRFLPKLIELRLEGNKFQGEIPDFLQKTWLSFNVSNNELDGRIPTSLKHMDKSSFSGKSPISILHILCIKFLFIFILIDPILMVCATNMPTFRSLFATASSISLHAICCNISWERII